MSLRKKISEDKGSVAHNSAVLMLKNRENDALKTSAAVQSQNLHDETCKVFRTAYYIAQSDTPYTDHPNLITLQQRNGINVGRVLRSNVTCEDITEHIAQEMRSNLIKNIIANKSHTSVLIDESTSLSSNMQQFAIKVNSLSHIIINIHIILWSSSSHLAACNLCQIMACFEQEASRLYPVS